MHIAGVLSFSAFQGQPTAWDAELPGTATRAVGRQRTQVGRKRRRTAGQLGFGPCPSLPGIAMLDPLCVPVKLSFQKVEVIQTNEKATEDTHSGGH